MSDYSRLAANWIRWSGLSCIPNASVIEDRANDRVVFKSREGSFTLYHQGDWWSLDETDDRGSQHYDTARFSTFALAEIYLIWTWASVARTAVGAKNLGAALYAAGFNPAVAVEEETPGVYKLSSRAGTAIVTGVKATIISHLMEEPVEKVEALVSTGF